MASRGPVFNIQRFSIHDGPGIRTTVFLQGCAMGCFWCHNPEGRGAGPQLLYNPDRCISCGECVKVCPTGAHTLQEGLHLFDRGRCEINGACVAVCASGALELTSKAMSVEEVMQEVDRDQAFYDHSGGGVTLSGGEPSLGGGFALELLRACKERGYRTAIETCGYVPWRALESLIPHLDLVMMDLKAMTPELHEEATGRSNETILENARRLARTSMPILFRTPVVPTVNDSSEEFGKIARFVASLVEERRRAGSDSSPIQLQLLRFHKLASDKYRRLGLDYRAAVIDSPTPETMARLQSVAREAGIDAQCQ